ncbi:MAG: hypothetical protein K2G89_05460 [Lachnospiraceae bacterium]|nr:hypothetical protein [Lachnospiraceae bacterium]
MGKKICLIDYENTALAGLDGLENLEPGDGLRIICSNDSIGNTLLHILSIYRERNITIEVEYMNQRGSNALDFRLSCDLGYFIAQGDVEQIYVVSKDKGYLHAISEASALNSDVLIVCGVSIRDCLFKVEHGMTELPIAGFAEPCKEAEDIDADMKLEWQQANTKANMNKTSKALGILKQRMPVIGKAAASEETKVKNTKKKTGKEKKETNQAAKQKKSAEKAKAEQPAKTDKLTKTGKTDKLAKAGKAADKPKPDKPVEKAGRHTDSRRETGKDAPAFSSLTNTQRKKFQQEIVDYIGQHTSLEENYAAHIAALVIKEPSVMEFRKSAKKTLGKKHEDYEAEIVAVYMHFRSI